MTTDDIRSLRAVASLRIDGSLVGRDDPTKLFRLNQNIEPLAKRSNEPGGQR